MYGIHALPSMSSQKNLTQNSFSPFLASIYYKLDNIILIKTFCLPIIIYFFTRKKGQFQFRTLNFIQKKKKMYFSLHLDQTLGVLEWISYKSVVRIIQYWKRWVRLCVGGSSNKHKFSIHLMTNTRISMFLVDFINGWRLMAKQ